MIVTVSIRQEGKGYSSHEQTLTHSVAVSGNLVQEFQRATQSAMNEVGLEALTRNWLA